MPLLSPWVAADDVPAPGTNRNTTVVVSRATTLDVTPPSLIGEWTINGTVDTVLPDRFDLVVQLDEPGAVYYVVIPHPSPPPTAADVAHFAAAEGAPEPAACGRFRVPVADSNVTHTAGAAQPPPWIESATRNQSLIVKNDI